MCLKFFFIFLPCRLFLAKLHLAATSLVDLITFSSSIFSGFKFFKFQQSLLFFQRNLDILYLYSHHKIEFLDVVNLDKNQQAQNPTSGTGKIKFN